MNAEDENSFAYSDHFGSTSETAMGLSDLNGSASFTGTFADTNTQHQSVQLNGWVNGPAHAYNLFYANNTFAPPLTYDSTLGSGSYAASSGLAPSSTNDSTLWSDQYAAWPEFALPLANDTFGESEQLDFDPALENDCIWRIDQFVASTTDATKRRGVNGPFKCAHLSCGKAFTRKADWERHNKQIHGGAKEFLCGEPGCFAASARKENIEKHRLRKHNIATSSTQSRRADDVSVDLPPGQALATNDRQYPLSLDDRDLDGLGCLDGLDGPNATLGQPSTDGTPLSALAWGPPVSGHEFREIIHPLLASSQQHAHAVSADNRTPSDYGIHLLGHSPTLVQAPASVDQASYITQPSVDNSTAGTSGQLPCHTGAVAQSQLDVAYPASHTMHSLPDNGSAGMSDQLSYHTGATSQTQSQAVYSVSLPMQPFPNRGMADMCSQTVESSGTSHSSPARVRQPLFNNIAAGQPLEYSKVPWPSSPSWLRSQDTAGNMPSHQMPIRLACQAPSGQSSRMPDQGPQTQQATPLPPNSHVGPEPMAIATRRIGQPKSNGLNSQPLPAAPGQFFWMHDQGFQAQLATILPPNSYVGPGWTAMATRRIGQPNSNGLNSQPSPAAPAGQLYLIPNQEPQIQQTTILPPNSYVGPRPMAATTSGNGQPISNGPNSQPVSATPTRALVRQMLSQGPYAQQVPPPPPNLHPGPGMVAGTANGHVQSSSKRPNSRPKKPAARAKRHRPA